jgi:hypothetical protein
LEKRITKGIPGCRLRAAIMLPHMKCNIAAWALFTELFDVRRVVPKRLS